MTKQEFDSSLFLTLSLEKRTSSLEKKRKKIKERERICKFYFAKTSCVSCYKYISINFSIARGNDK